MALEKDTPTPAAEVVNAVKLVGDVAILPGSSLLLQGKVLSGGAHGVLGFLGWRCLGAVAGPVAWIALAANAYSKASSGAYLHDYVIELFGASTGRPGTTGTATKK